MYRPRLKVLLPAVLLLALLAGNEIFRHSAFAFLRFPFRVIRSAVKSLVLLPRLGELAYENQKLQETLLQKQLELAGLKEQMRTSEQARLLTASSDLSGIVASVLGRSLLATQHTVLLNRGSAEGIVLDGLVVNAAGVVGRVRELQEHESLVLLITDSESRIGGLIERSREMGLLVGRTRGVCELIYLDADADVQEQDRVVSAGLNPQTPKGLLLGTVHRVIRDPLRGMTKAEVIPAVRFGRIEDVLCLLPQGS